MKRIRLVCTILCLFFLCSCGNNNHKKTLSMGERFYTALMLKEYREVLMGLNVENEPNIEQRAEEWVESQQFVFNKLGELESFDIVEWNIEYIFKQEDQPDGIYFNMQYQLEYEKSSALSNLILFKPLFSDIISFYNFHIESEGLNE